MKRIGILASIFCGALCSMVWAQEPAIATNSKHPIFQRRAMMRMSRMQATRISAQALPAHSNQIWQFGTYPGGTWAALEGINDFGVAVGFGDVPPLGKGPSVEGYTHTLAVPVFTPGRMTTRGKSSSRGRPSWPSTFGDSSGDLIRADHRRPSPSGSSSNDTLPVD